MFKELCRSSRIETTKQLATAVRLAPDSSKPKVNFHFVTLINFPTFWFYFPSFIVQKLEIFILLLLKVFVAVTGVGYYAPDEDKVYDESGAQGSDWLAELAGDWEAEARQSGIRTVILRYRESGKLMGL